MSKLMAVIIMIALLGGGSLMGFFHEEGSGLNQSFWFWTGAAIILPCLIYGGYLFVRGMGNWIREW